MPTVSATSTRAARSATYSDPDASWGHRSAVSTRASGSFYGYKLHQVVCAITGLPLAWRVETAKDAESTFAMPLLDAVKARGFRPEIAVMDMGYDHEAIYAECEARECHPIIPLRETPAVKAGKHKPPVCEHGQWTFAGSDEGGRRAAAMYTLLESAKLNGIAPSALGGERGCA